MKMKEIANEKWQMKYLKVINGNESSINIYESGINTIVNMKVA